ncbi:MAG: hypothetical protein MN733_08710 [Nitrososphaera sp.]|nr:hypothetical protein [Nitrososphaera sp.]
MAIKKGANNGCIVIQIGKRLWGPIIELGVNGIGVITTETECDERCLIPEYGGACWTHGIELREVLMGHASGIHKLKLRFKLPPTAQTPSFAIARNPVLWGIGIEP